MVQVYTEATPNPEAIKFVSSRVLLHLEIADYPDQESASGSPFALALFEFPFVKAVFLSNNFVTIIKVAKYEWFDIQSTLREFIKTYLESDKEIISAGNGSSSMIEDNSADSEVVKKIKELLEKYVRPAVEMDGGAIQFKSFNEGVLNLILKGSCSGCPSSVITLKAGIEGMLKQQIPELVEVVAEDG
ncbi:MAG: NifU family protein [Bacteroidetes bacterium]|nr:NifU family protein [Bacteroidota bacterium]